MSLGTLGLVNGTGLASNYTLVGGTRLASITPATLTIAAGSASKVYDGDTLADVTLDSFTGLVGSETVTAAGPVAGTFNSKNVAEATLVTLGSVTLADGSNGGLASNYSFANGQTLAGTITAKALTATANASDKVYDGNTTAIATLTNLTGLLGSETLGATGTATFNSKDVADANLVTINSTTLTDGANGGLASNYSLAGGQVATAHITPKALTVVGADGVGQGL
ncbi:MAG: YDG domain-containing protein [Gammaproteobacteria bacterium]